MRETGHGNTSLAIKLDINLDKAFYEQNKTPGKVCAHLDKGGTSFSFFSGQRNRKAGGTERGEGRELGQLRQLDFHN